MTNPVVTIITPAYNCAAFLKETIESVLNQSYPDIDYIVINDGSTDETKELLKSYEKEVTIINQTNRGEQVTVNNGLRMVTGKYFMIVNADDPLYPDCVENMVKAMELNPHVLCAYPDWDIIDEQSKFKLHYQTRDYDFKWMVANHTCIPGVGSLFRSDIIKWMGYRNESYRWLGDFDYWLRIGLAGQMLRVPMTLARWRSRDNQASKDKSDLRAKEHIRIYTELFKQSVPKPIRKVEATAKTWSYLVAASVTSDKLKVMDYVVCALMNMEGVILSWSFWDAFTKRVIYILRR